MNPALDVPKVGKIGEETERSYTHHVGFDYVEIVDVPPGKSPDDVYDVLLDGDLVGNRLCVRMPPGGRKTRIFARGGMRCGYYVEDGDCVKIVYMDENSLWDESTKSWSSGYEFDVVTGKITFEGGTIISPENYEGNLLLFISHAVEFGFAGTGEEKTFANLTATIVAPHILVHSYYGGFTVYGQIFANDIHFDGHLSDEYKFRYVPFGLTKPSSFLFPQEYFDESDEEVIVPVELGGPLSQNTGFDYCFELTSEVPTRGKTKDGRADISDFNSIPHLCGKDTGHVEILAGSTEPTEETQIRINVKNDLFHEHGYGALFDENPPDENPPEDYAILEEGFVLKTFNYKGVIPATASEERSVWLGLNESLGVPIASIVEIHIKEDETYTFSLLDFPYSHPQDVPAAGIIINNSILGENLTYKDEPVKDGLFIPVDSIPDLKISEPMEKHPGYDEKYGFMDASIDFFYVDVYDNFCHESLGAIHLVVNAVNDAPIAYDTTYALGLHHEAGAVLEGRIRVQDVDDSRFLFYFDEEDSRYSVVNSLFEMDSVSGRISLKPDARLTQDEYSIRVVVEDLNESHAENGPQKSTAQLTIQIRNFPPSIVAKTRQVIEHSMPGTVIDTLRATDPNGDSVFTYSLAETSEYFELSAGGVVTIKENADINYNQNKTLTLKVYVADEIGAKSSETYLSYRVVPVNAVPVAFDTIFVLHNRYESDAGPFGKIRVEDEDDENFYFFFDNESDSYSEVNRYFELDSLSGEVRVRGGEVPSKNDYEIKVLVIDFNFEHAENGQQRTTADIKIHIDNQNPQLTEGEFHVKENAPGETFVGQLLAEDPDGDPVEFFLTEKSETFDLSRDGKITVQKNAAIDYEKVNAYSLKVVVSDPYGGISEEMKVAVVVDDIPSPTMEIDSPDTLFTNRPELVLNCLINDGKPEKCIDTTLTEGKNTLVYVYEDENYEDTATDSVVVFFSSSIPALSLKIENGLQDDSVFYVKSANVKMHVSLQDSSIGRDTSFVFSARLDQMHSDENWTVEKLGEVNGNAEYAVTYSYRNVFDNHAVASVQIVVDSVPPEVKILTPKNNSTYSVNYAHVEWTADGVLQDTLALQELKAGPNRIVRSYTDKAGNVAADTIYVVLMNFKDMNVGIENAVTEMSRDLAERYYETHPYRKGENFAISVKNPSTGVETETQSVGSFGKRTLERAIPSLNNSETSHLGPTLVLDLKLPSELGTTECDGGLYDNSVKAKIWVYTALGHFLGFYSFAQSLNNPDYVDETHGTQLFFELKPDENGEIYSEDGRAWATGAYVIKAETALFSKLRCDELDEKGKIARKKGDVVRTDANKRIRFGYRRLQ